jgi:hypothetical protein
MFFIFYFIAQNLREQEKLWDKYEKMESEKMQKILSKEDERNKQIIDIEKQKLVLLEKILKQNI